MSDVSQGTGWWQASDGKWYPPQQAPMGQSTQPQMGQQPPGAVHPGWSEPPKKSKTGRNVLVTLGTLLVLGTGGCAALIFAGGAAVENAAESTDQAVDEELEAIDTSETASASSNETTESAEAPYSESSFVDGVLTTPEMVITITDHKTIAPGEEGNSYGDKPVIAFWYDITNLTEADMSPMDWLYAFSAYQDTNPDAENELEIGSLPDSSFLDTQMENIKKGGTVQNAVAYELDDQTTPVELVAADLFGDSEFGRMEYSPE